MRLAVLLLLLAGLVALRPAAAQDIPLRAGWYAGEPQQFLQHRAGREVLTGLDIEMVRAIAARARHSVTFTPTTGREQPAALAEARLDLATGIAWTAQRAAGAAFTRAYRQDVDVLIVRRGEAAALAFTDANGLARFLARGTGFRLGVQAGFTYLNEALDRWIADPANAGRLRRADDDRTNLRRLLDGEIDGFLAERLSVALLISQAGAGRQVEEHPFRLRVPLHLMFGRHVPAQTVAAFDAAILALEQEGRLDRIAARFRFPLLLTLTLGSTWFLVLEIIGTLAAALSGTLAAKRGGYSLFGTLVLAGITATAGGILRDLLVDRHPIGVMASPLYLSLVAGTVAATWLAGHAWAALRNYARVAFRVSQAAMLMRRHAFDRLAFELSDSLGLAAFTVLGVAVALATQASPLWLWGPILGTLTGAGGGILRDIVRGGGDIPNLRSGVYGEVAFGWALALSAYLLLRRAEIESEEMVLVVVTAVLGAAATRMAAVLGRWRAPRMP